MISVKNDALQGGKVFVLVPKPDMAGLANSGSRLDSATLNMPLPGQACQEAGERIMATLEFFKKAGHLHAEAFRELVTSISEALGALATQQESTALFHLRQAEVLFGRLTPHFRGGIKGALGERAVHHGCSLALSCLKDAALSCLRSVLRKDTGELVKAQCLFGDAAVAVLAAKQMASLR